MPARTTITLDDDVRAKLKTEMRKTGKSFRELVNETLRLGLISRKAVPNVKPYKVRAKNLGLKPGYSFDKPWELIEEIEGANFR